MEEGLTLVATKRFFLGYANVMKFKKNGKHKPSIQREVQFKCLKCGHDPMEKNSSGYICSQCDHKYVLDDGIIISISS